jgi:hypothetical protein
VATGRLPTFHGRLKVMTEIDNYHINFILEPESVHFSFLLMVKNSLELSYVENLQNQNQSVEMRMKPLKYKQRILQRQLWIVNYYGWGVIYLWAIYLYVIYLICDLPRYM